MSQPNVNAESDLFARLASLSPAKRRLLEQAIRGSAARPSPIAVVGLGCRFAGARSVDEFWRLIREQRVATGEIPPSRWDVDELYDPSGQTPGKMHIRWGGFVDDVDQFDPTFFGISPRETENMDPQQRLLLEVAWEALEYGAIPPSRLAGSNTGTFVGIGGVDYSRIPARMDDYLERINLYSGTGNALSIASNRLAYILDLRGPSVSVDTACSSGMVAIHLAIASLRNGECDAALAGGCNLILSPESTLAFSKAQMLSPDGICRPFDADANGYVRGEGCGLVVLKRLDNALADGDRVFAVIRGSAVNQDGRTSGIAAPNPRSQERVIRAAHEEAGIRPSDVTYLEAHGTGTPLGDPMEWEALGKIFRDDGSASRPCYVGSVKANIGHTETASGVAGLIKTILMMREGEIPPQPSFQRLNPRISLDGTRLVVAEFRGQRVDGESLPAAEPLVPASSNVRRIAGVSSFGFGGTNAHLVVEEPPEPAEQPSPPDRPIHVLTLSAKTDEALDRRARQLADYLADHPSVSLPDVCFSANAGRSHFAHRMAVTCESSEQLRDALRVCPKRGTGTLHLGSGLGTEHDTREPVPVFGQTLSSPVVHRGRRPSVGRPRVAMLFSGQGCQYVGMGRRLFEYEPVFRDAMLECDELLAESLDVPLLALLHRPEHAERLDQTRYLQPALFAIQYSLSRLWLSWGITPDVVLGHSVGEFAAVCVAGVLDVEDAIELIDQRARLMSELPPGGAMAAVFADADTVSRKIGACGGDVEIAALNGPGNTVVSGTVEAVDRLVAEFEREGVRSTRLAVSHGFHSALMEPMLDEFHDFAATLDYRPPRIRMLSSVTGEPIEVIDAEYWRDQVRQPVRFHQAIRRLAQPWQPSPAAPWPEQGVSPPGRSAPAGATTGSKPSSDSPEIVLEIGPSATAIGMARRCDLLDDPAWLPSLKKGGDDCAVLFDTLAAMYARGVDVDFESVDRPWPRRRLSLPTYPFERRRYWLPEADGGGLPGSGSGLASVAVRGSRFRHPLLGAEVPSPLQQRLFVASLDSRTPSLLADHRVQGSVVMPAAGYIEQGLAAAAYLCGSPQENGAVGGRLVVENLAIQQAMILKQDSGRAVHTVLTPESGSEYRFEIHGADPATRDGEPGEQHWTLHACGTLGVEAEAGGGNSNVGTRRVEGAGLPSPDDFSEHIAGGDFYARMAERGLAYGPSFQVIEQLHAREGEALARLALPDNVKRELPAYQAHPALLDAGLQAIAGVVGAVDHTGGGGYLPTFVRRVCVRHAHAEPAWAHALRCKVDASQFAPVGDTMEADVRLLDATGEVVVELEGVRIQRIGPAGAGRESESKDWVYTIAWHQLVGRDSSEIEELIAREVPETSWLIFNDGGGVGRRLAQRLQELGGDCTLVRQGQAFRRLGAGDSPADAVYEIDPSVQSDYEKLLEAWQASGSAASIETGYGIAFLGNRQETPEDDEHSEPLHACVELLHLTHALDRAELSVSPKVCVVTRGAQAVGEDDPASPGQAASWGFARVAANEYPRLQWRLLDLDPNEIPDQNVDHILAELTDGGPENQIALRGTERFAARLERRPDAVDRGESEQTVAAVSSGPRQLRFERAGTFDALYFAPMQRAGSPGGRPLEPDQVEIEVHSAGLNFSDVLKAMGLYPGITDPIVPMGIECAGIVAATGSDVTRLQPGDRVMGVAPFSFATHAISAEYALVKTPEALSDDEAATIPITFLTAHYALCHLARLGRGERVLIHAGAGGVGLAAIQIAQQAGATIFATAGSDEKRDFLRSLGVAHVMNSRTLEFADEIQCVTEGHGVDVVLNGLPGKAIERSLAVLGPYGRFLEIGKTDIYQNRMIGLLPFQDNLSYFAIDLDRMLRQRPDYIRELFEEVIARFQSGAYRPLPMTRFRDAEVQDAFRYMAQRKNIGKIVVSIESHESEQPVEGDHNDHTTLHSTIRDDATYLVTGGLGAIGLRVARWLVERGARFVALMGRRAPSAEAREVIDQLCGDGAQVAVLRGDVSDLPSLRGALDQLPADAPPVRGVFHAAGVLADALLRDMDVATLEKPLAPKVDGAWNLHVATQDCPLDHFVLFSSIAGVLGSPGQANYAAGNAALDALAQRRRAEGRPAVSISWGPWAVAGASGGGMAAGVQDQLAARGMDPMPEDDAIALLEAALGDAPAHLVAARVDWNRLIASAGGHAPPLFAHLADTETSPDGRDEIDEALRDQLAVADPEARVVLLQEYIATEAARLMAIDPAQLDCDQPLSSLGLDSLVGMELKAKLESRLGTELPMEAMLENPSVHRLAEVLAAEWGEGDTENARDAGRQAPDAGPPVSGAATRGDESLPPDDSPSFEAAGVLPSTSASPGSDSQPSTADSVPTRPSRQRRSSSPGWSPVVKLASGADGSPLICVHPVGGDISCYRPLVHCLRSQHPVWALRARGLEEGTTPHTSVEEMARDYIAALPRQVDTGTVRLAGWSTGGIFAYEMTRQLVAGGLRVEALWLIDTPTPSIFEGVDLDDDARFLADLVEFSNWFAGTNMRVDYDQLAGLQRDAALRIVFAEGERHGVLPPEASVDYLRRLVTVCRENSRAVMQYPLRPLGPGACRVHLIRPADTHALASASGKDLTADLGWGEVLGDRLANQQVPGDHFSMMTGENVSALASVLLGRIIQ